MPVIFVGHQAAPNPAVFPDQVYDPTQQVPPSAPASWRFYGRQLDQNSGAMAPSPAVLPAPPYDPTGAPPFEAPVGYVRPSRDGSYSIVTLVNPANFADEVFDPRQQSPQQARPGIARPSKTGSYSSSMPPNWVTLPVAAYDPTTEPPPSASPPTIHLPSKDGSFSSVSLVNPATFADEVFDPRLRAPWFATPGLQGYIKQLILRRAPGVPEAANILIPSTIPPAQDRQYFIRMLMRFFPYLPRGIIQAWDPDLFPVTFESVGGNPRLLRTRIRQIANGPRKFRQDSIRRVP